MPRGDYLALARLPRRTGSAPSDSSFSVSSGSTRLRAFPPNADSPCAHTRTHTEEHYLVAHADVNQRGDTWTFKSGERHPVEPPECHQGVDLAVSSNVGDPFTRITQDDSLNSWFYFSHRRFSYITVYEYLAVILRVMLDGSHDQQHNCDSMQI